MSKYRFRLATLEKMRIAHRDELRAALADGYRAEQILAEQQSSLAAELATLKESQRAVLTAPFTDINQLIESQRYESVLLVQAHALKEQSARLAVEVERRRLAAVEADRAVRVLEKLDDRRREEHRQETQLAEMKQLDEVASFRRTRN